MDNNQPPRAAGGQPPRKRTRVTAGGGRASEAGNAGALPSAIAPQGWAPAPHQHNPHGVRPDSVPPPTTGYPSQQQLVDRSSHQVAVTDGMMNGNAYGNSPHSQYPDPSLASAPQQADLGSLTSLPGDPGVPNPHHTQNHQQHHLQHHPQQQQQLNHQQHQLNHQQEQQPQQQQQHQQSQQRPPAATANKTDQVFLQPRYHPADDSPTNGVANSAASTSYGLQGWSTPGPVSASVPSAMPPQSPSSIRLAPPPEGIYETFDSLLAAVQKVAKDQGYGVVKLRSSNYRDKKPTRYDLVCDRGGVKYSSTAKKRTPSTRKVDCPWRAKAVCEVSLGNQWRLAIQDSRHNHEPRIAAAEPGQENTPMAQSMRSIGHKIDRVSHDLHSHMVTILQRLDQMDKRMEAIEGRPQMMNSNGVPNMGNSNMPPGGGGMGGGSMGGGMGGGLGGGLGGGGMTNGVMGAAGLLDNRMSNMESRVNAAMEQRSNPMDLTMMDDDTSRLSMMGNGP